MPKKYDAVDWIILAVAIAVMVLLALLSTGVFADRGWLLI